MKIKFIISLTSLLFTMLLLSLWFSGSFSSISTLNMPIQNQAPDFVITGLRSQQFDEQGQLKYTVKARTLTHYPTGIAYLTQPQLSVNDTRQAWYASATQGEVNDTSQQAQLSQQVLLYPAESNWRLHTDDLSIDLNHSVIETHRPVLLEHPSGKLTAVGLRGSLSNHQLDLLAHVQGQYTPHP